MQSGRQKFSDHPACIKERIWGNRMESKVRRFEMTTDDGLVLRGEIFGDRLSNTTPVLCLPGLTRNSRDFHPLAEYLTSDPNNSRFVIVLNSRGRGPSDYDKNQDNYNIMTEARDALDVLAAAGLPNAIIIGTSRGGLLALAIAAMRPCTLAGVVFNDIGPVINTMGLARIKTYLNKSKPVKDWDDAITYSKIANSRQFPALSEEHWEQLARMTFRDEDGRPTGDFDRHIATGLATIDLTQPLPTAWPQFMAMSHCPVLVLRGENSDILDEQTALEMVKRHPDCQLYTAKGQGHAPLFLIKDLNKRVATFLAEVDEKRQEALPQTVPAWLDEEDIIYLKPTGAQDDGIA